MLYLSELSVGDIRCGVEALAGSRRSVALLDWLEYAETLRRADAISSKNSTVTIFTTRRVRRLRCSCR